MSRIFFLIFLFSCGKPVAPRPVQAEVVVLPTAQELGIIEEDLLGSVSWDVFCRKVGVTQGHKGTIADPIPVDVDLLGAWEFRYDLDNPFPPFVKALHGKVVRIKGFMLPDIEFEEISKFHLVRSLWGCCFGAPPRVNEMVRVNVPEALRIDITYNTLDVVGRFEVIFEMEDGLIEDPYRLEALSLTELGFEDPEAPADFDPEAGFQGILPGNSTEF